MKLRDLPGKHSDLMCSSLGIEDLKWVTMEALDDNVGRNET